MACSHRRDHRVAMVARILAGTGLTLLGALLIRSLPDLLRYAKMERM
jgi:hypothetical protein